MKKALIFVFIIASSILDSKAQDSTFVAHTYIGIKAGYNYGTAAFSHALQRINTLEGYNTGFHFGLIGINYLEKTWGFQFELNYTQKGWTQVFDEPVPKYTTDLSYIDLPMYLHAYVGNKKTRLFFNLGAYAEYLIGVSKDDDPTDTQGYDFNPYDESRDRKFGYGLIAGGGIYRDFSFGTIMLQGEFSYGLSNVLDPITEDSGIPDISNLLTSHFSVGYLFKIQK